MQSGDLDSNTHPCYNGCTDSGKGLYFNAAQTVNTVLLKASTCMK